MQPIFFTVNLANRNLSLLIDHVELLRHVMKKVKEKHPFQMDTVAVLPDHLHALWTLPHDDFAYSTRWALIKARFSRELANTERISSSRAKKGERGIWQRRFWEHLIRDERDYKKHVDYIHFNPVKHGHVERVANWRYSSFHRFVAAGILPGNWGSDASLERIQVYGEFF